MAMIKTSWKKVNEDDKKDDYDSITPSGFKQKEYSKDVVLGKYLYHRCHVIGWNLGGIDVDERNLMTGTRDFNIKGMKKFEDEVYNYLKKNQTNHVLYRVTPYFEGENELASGVNIEAYSIMENYTLMYMCIMYKMESLLIMQQEKAN